MTSHVVVKVLFLLEDGVAALHRADPDARLAVQLQVSPAARLSDRCGDITRIQKGGGGPPPH